MESIDFDNDHLYVFQDGRKPFQKNYFGHEVMDEEDDLAEETLLGYLKLKKGKKIKYVYDFGDNWEFTICVKEVKDEVCQNPGLISKKGEAPEQYNACYW